MSACEGGQNICISQLIHSLIFLSARSLFFRFVNEKRSVEEANYASLRPPKRHFFHTRKKFRDEILIFIRIQRWREFFLFRLLFLFEE